jgi:exodeoxyribonuclease V gamma subunit
MIFLSHRLEKLVDHLSERLSSEAWVLLPSLAMKQWLMVELVKRSKNQALAGIQFISYREAIERLTKPIHTLELRLELSKIFQTVSDGPLAPILHWIQEGHSSRLNMLLSHLSRQIYEASFYQKAPTETWQQELYEKLSIQRQWQKPVGELHCFCTDEMPPDAWDFWMRQNASIYLFSPCRMYWEDSLSNRERQKTISHLKTLGISSSSLTAFENYIRDTHPLLANWGKLGRKTFSSLSSANITEDYEGGAEDLDDVHEAFRKGRLSLLEVLQQDILLLRTSDRAPIPKDPKDDSIQFIQAGSSKLREMQILKDSILHFLKKSKDASWPDILVIAPDIRPYAPLIRFVFEEEMPIRISPVPVLEQSLFLQGLMLFFDLSLKRFDADLVMELIENRSFCERHQLSNEDIQMFRHWLKEARVRGTWDEGPSSFSTGIERMMDGLVFLLPDDEPLPRVRSMDWGQAERLDRFIQLVQSVHRHVKNLEEKRSLDDWVISLRQMADELFSPTDGNDEIFRSFLRRLSQASHRFSDPFDFSILHSFFSEECAQATTSYKGLNLDAIHFSSLQPGAIRPAQALFFIGMDIESFSGHEARSTFDWKCPKASRSDQNRYWMLQALFAARKELSISYRHLSERDGKPIEPALPIQELFQLINDYYPSIQYLKHPPLPFDAKYFEKKSPLQSFSQEDFHAANSIVAYPKIFWPEKKLQTETRSFLLSDLTKLIRNPWRYFLEKSLSIYLKDESLFVEDRLEDFALPPYLQQHLLKLSFTQPIDEVILERRHLFAKGSFGEAAAIQLKQKAAEYAAQLKKWSIDSISSIPFMQEIDGCTIQGDIDGVTPSGILSMSDLSLFSLLRIWPSYLALRSLKPDAERIYSLKKGAIKTFGHIDTADALKRLIGYAIEAEKSLSPLIYPWADAILKKEFHEFEKLAEISLLKEDDVSLQWVLKRSQPLPLSNIWKEWRGFLQKTFAEVYDAAV